MSEIDPFGTWLKRRRKTLDLTREALARRAHCSVSTIRRLEAGDLRAGVQLAESLAVALAIPIDQRADFVRFARGDHSLLQSLPVGRADRQSDTPSTPSATIARPPSIVSNLPAPLTSFVGRQREINAICELLNEPGVRLLTLTGPPGTGKTRLSLAVAQQFVETAATFSDGIYFVPLAPIDDARLVLSALAQVLGVRESPSTAGLLDPLHHFLRDRRVLIVLDNFEQVIDAAPLVTDLLSHAPRLKMLITSREVLHVYGEHEFPVPALALPDVKHLPTNKALSYLGRFASLQLFRDRARAVKTDFQLTPDNVAEVARICAWLDGLPLAIEMAAAQVKWLPLPQLLKQLSHRLTTLTGGPIDLSPRQQSLTGAIEWSFELLNEEEQRLFSLLGIFVDGCTKEALSALAAAHADSIHQPISSARALVEKSLLRYDLTTGREPRFVMLESIREYARARLNALGLADEVAHWHARYFEQLSQTAAYELADAQHDLWLQRCELELNNFRAALQWCRQQAPAIGLQLAANLCDFWYLRGLLTEGRAWLDDLLARGAGCPDNQRVTALTASALLAVHQGDLSHATQTASEALRLSRTSGDGNGIARALHGLGNVALYQSHYAQAEAFYAEALPWYLEHGPRAHAAQVMNNLGLVAKDQGDFTRAIRYFENSLALRRDIGHQHGIAQSLLNLANAAYWQGNFDRTLELAGQALDLSRHTGYALNVGYALEALGMAWLKQGQLDRAGDALRESAAHFAKLGDKKGSALVLIGLGTLARVQAQWVEAAQLHRESLKLCVQIGEKRRLAFCLEGLALVACSQARFRRTVTLLAAAHILRAAAGAPLPAIEQVEIDRALTEARAALNESAFDAAWAAGKTMSVDEVVDLALGNEPLAADSPVA